jgi:serine/threonine protein kinase
MNPKPAGDTPSEQELKEQVHLKEVPEGAEAAAQGSGELRNPTLPQPGVAAFEGEVPEAGLPAVGTQLGRYKLLAVIGSGGMSTVYRAWDTSLAREVAVKFLLPRMGAAIDRARFQQEALAASKLSHTNIIDVYDYNITGDGIPYIVLPYLRGETLESALQADQRLPFDRWLSIMRQACRAMAHAHENGVIHRDVKPSNLIVCREDNTEVIKLVDFGIAKCQGTEKDGALTKTGDIIGSPVYMSPEQCNGAKIDARSDIYSFGCVMYEALAGKPPLMGETSLNTVLKHLHTKPVPLKHLCPELPNVSSVNAVVMRCLEKNPDDRYSSMRELLKDLDELAAGGKIRHSTGLRKLARSQVVLISLLVVFLTFVASSAYMIFGNHEPQPDSVIGSIERDRGNAYSPAAESYYKARENNARRSYELSVKNNADSSQQGDKLTHLARAEQEAGNFKNAIDDYKKALQLLPPPDGARVSQLRWFCLEGLAFSLCVSGDLSGGANYARQAEDVSINDQEKAQDMVTLANCANKKSDYSGAEGLLREVLAMDKLREEISFKANLSLCASLRGQNKNAEARQYLTQAEAYLAKLKTPLQKIWHTLLEDERAALKTIR